MLKKLTRLGRISLPVILILFILLPVRANTQGINKISLKGRNITIAALFKNIKKQTGLTVFYSNKLLDDTEKISVDFNRAELAEVMNVALKGKGLSWVVKEKYIVLQKAAPAAVLIDNKADQGAVNNARQKIIGTVTDDLGLPMAGVGVKVKETNAGTVTDGAGRYSIEANSGNALLFSYLGYTTQEILVGNQTSINVKMQADDTDLTEVVVVGYGTQKKVNLTGAVSMISGKDLAARPMGQTSAALQGMAPGVTIRQSSGRPGGDGGSIRIRGVGTITDPNPLVMIDGIEGSINNIDPNLIESISILKDAASSSIYGSRAANGVILVTTKRANNDQISISYNNYIGWQDPTNMPKLVNALDYMLLINEAYANTGRTPLYANPLIDKYREQNGRS